MVYINTIISFLTGQSLYSSELQSFCMAVQGNLIIVSRYNNPVQQQQTLPWFYRFLQSILIGFSGGIFGTILLGKPGPFLINDIHLFSCIAAFILVQVLHNSVIHKYIWNSIPVQMIITSYAQLFRTLGLIKFVTVCYNTLLEPQFIAMSTKYYNIPIFGPIVYGTLLGNMSGFLLLGIDGHTKNGMPYPFQNGIFCASFYHFFVHDTTGIIGVTLRHYLQPLSSFVVGYMNNNENVTNEVVATILISLFMQTVALLQMSILYGPTFSPFVVFNNQIIKFLSPFQQSVVVDDKSITTKATVTGPKTTTKSKKTTKTAEGAKNKDL